MIGLLSVLGVSRSPGGKTRWLKYKVGGLLSRWRGALYSGPTMGRIDFTGKWIVVTGASSGLGREIARLLAVREGAHVVLAARRRELLDGLAGEIRAQAPAAGVVVVPVDLADPAGAQALFREATAGRDVFGLVNCAGVTHFGRTLDISIEKTDRIVGVNFRAEIATTLLFLGHFLDRRAGAILTVTSGGAFQPLPYQNVYSATKAGMQSFMEALSEEYRGRGVTFSTFAPAGVDTEMIRGTRFAKTIGILGAGQAAALAISGFKRRKLRIIPRAVIKLGTYLSRVVPRGLVLRVAGRIFRP
jgi:uncharacterized protein